MRDRRKIIEKSIKIRDSFRNRFRLDIIGFWPELVATEFFLARASSVLGARGIPDLVLEAVRTFGAPLGRDLLVPVVIIFNMVGKKNENGYNSLSFDQKNL